MNALLLTVFVSAVLLVYGLVQFVAAWSRGEHLQADRLALLPLDDSASVTVRETAVVVDGGEQQP